MTGTVPDKAGSIFKKCSSPISSQLLVRLLACLMGVLLLRAEARPEPCLSISFLHSLLYPGPSPASSLTFLPAAPACPACSLQHRLDAYCANPPHTLPCLLHTRLQHHLLPCNQISPPLLCPQHRLDRILCKSSVHLTYIIVVNECNGTYCCSLPAALPGPHHVQEQRLEGGAHGDSGAGGVPRRSAVQLAVQLPLPRQYSRLCRGPWRQGQGQRRGLGEDCLLRAQGQQQPAGQQASPQNVGRWRQQQPFSAVASGGNGGIFPSDHSGLFATLVRCTQQGPRQAGLR
jgi:hypothetical protein